MRSYSKHITPSRTLKNGKKAQYNGKLAESHLLNTDCHSALIYKRHEPYRRLTGGTVFKAQSLEKAGCDYSIYTPHAAGMIEVKSRDSDRIATAALDEKQHQQLAQLSEWGHIALVLARLKEQWYCIPYSDFIEPPKGKKSWNTKELTASKFKVEQGMGGILCLQSHLDRHYPACHP